ncbi:protease [Pyxidicoccus sp. MSG2]|uniref:protease n=1 Tax=Pyxidicoccus sp. MSG2 TaxID=2996790 RepID=UPI002272176C|nr:protease [Pyxidicoccus sp. MSG2]MCY1019714.1 protease [Pyxidicoccus sp. MSG2]
MTRGKLSLTLLCLGVMGGACASRSSEGTPPPAAARQEESAMATTLECALSAPKTVKAGEPVEVVFRLTNPTAKPLYVLDWHTPLEGLLNDIFQITRDGTELSYAGPMLKRGNPGADDYVAVAPGASVEGRVNVALAYDFTQPGRYRIAFRGRLMDVATQQAEVPHTLDGFRELPVKCPEVETAVVAP